MEYRDGGLRLAGLAAAIAEMRALLALARAAGMPVVHIAHHGRPGAALFGPAGPQVAIIPAVAPADGEAVVVKSLPNAFAGTALSRLIGESGRRELVVAGFATHMRVGATVRTALDLGYRTTVVAAACATRDLPDPLGGIVPAETVHRAALAALADRFAVVVADSARLTAVAAGTEVPARL